MKVIQVRLKILIKQDLHLDDVQSRVCGIIDFSFSKEQRFLDIHNENRYKYYCFDLPYPSERDKIYKRRKVYTITIRTMDFDLADFFSNSILDVENRFVKILSSEVSIIPKKNIQKIYSLTPIILKTETGYWRDDNTEEELKRRLKENLIKKYNSIYNERIDEDFEFFKSIEIVNRKPIAVKYKKVRLLGDKLTINIEDNAQAQKLAYVALGCGLGEMNSRGLGFVNYK